NVLVMKIANTGGPAGFFMRSLPREQELAGDLVAALLPAAVRAPELDARMRQAWMTSFSPGYRERQKHLAELEKKIAETEAATPRTMVMQELPVPRPTFVLMRGAYDKADP